MPPSPVPPAWLVYELQKHDRNITLPCLGWVAVDAMVILGVLVNR